VNKINYVIVGYGGMGSYHAHTLIPTAKDYIQLAGVFDIKEERLVVAREKGLKTYTSYQAVLADETVDAVLLATPNDVHKKLAIAALQAGKQVVSEKPATLSVQEFDEILAVSKQTGQTYLVHQNRRWDPDFLVVRELMKAKPIGELFQIESRVHGANGIPGDWRHKKAQGGGMVLDWGVHLLDQLLFLVKSPLKSVWADLSYILGDEVDDGFLAFLTFENGVKAIAEVGTTNYTRLPRWYVKGLNGTATIEDWDLTGTMVKANGQATGNNPTPIQAGVGLTKTMAPPSEEATTTLALPAPVVEYDPFYVNLYHVLRDGAEPVVKNEEVRNVLQLMEMIFESGKTGEVVRV
jgi:predicted dehydrogenase